MLRDANSFVNWNHDWIQIRWDFYVQPQYASNGYYWPSGTMVSAATGFELLPWIGVVSQSGFPNGAYTSYFSDFQFYINP